MKPSSPIRVIRDPGVKEALPVLADAWNTDETFFFLPERGAPDPAWITARLENIPAPLWRDHFILLTSGSTGQPKLVIGRRSRAEALARLLHQTQQLDAISETLLALPLTYCFAFVNQWLWGHLHQRSVIATAGLANPNAFLAALEHTNQAMLCLVGAQLPLLQGVLGDRVFASVRHVNFAGGRFPQESLPLLSRWFPEARILNNYGCAEAMPRLTQREAREAEEAAVIGRPLPGVRLQAAENNALLFQSPFAAVGFVDGDGFHAVNDAAWLPTGDLAEPLSDGQWRLLGRASEVFKRFGEKIALPAMLETLRAVCTFELAAYIQQDATGEDGYVLVLGGPADKASARALLAVFRDHFPRPHWPLRIDQVPALPLLANGKPDLLKLRTLPALELWRQRI